MAENFPNLVTDTKPKIEEVQKIPNRLDVKTSLHLDILYPTCRKPKKKGISWKQLDKKHTSPIKEQE